MNANSYLDPSSLKLQCQTAISNLSSDNETYREINRKIQNFISNTSFYSEAIQALKKELVDYQLVIRTLIAANEYDIQDYSTLCHRVGSETLIGQNIIDGQQTALQSKKYYEDLASDARQKASNTMEPTLVCHYTYKANCYDSLAENVYKTYVCYQDKAERYDEIDAATRNLFSASSGLRQSARNGIAQLSGFFPNGSYIITDDTTWKQEILQHYADLYYETDENGKLIPNWDRVEQCMQRDADHITQEEYEQLALIYMNLEGEEIGDFLNLCMDRGEDVNVSLSLNLKPGLTIMGDDYTEWSVNKKKINHIFDRLRLESDKLLVELILEEDTMENSALTGERNAVLEKMTLLEVLKGIGDVRSTYQSETPEITIENTKDALILRFKEECMDTDMQNGYLHTLGNSSVTISWTEVGSNIATASTEHEKKETADYFGIYSLVGNIAGTSADNVNGFLMEEFILNNVLDGIKIDEGFETAPVLGTIAETTIDITQSIEKYQKDKRFLETSFAKREAAVIYDHYDCSVNYVTYATSDRRETVLYAYEGEDTADKVLKSNNLLDYAVRKEDILCNPQKVYDEVLVLMENPDWKLLYENIISKK